MTRYFEIAFSDLSSEAQENMVDSIIESLTGSYQEEGEGYLKKLWNDPKPKSWQEAYCRMSAIEWRMWSDYEKGTPDAEVPTIDDWKYWIDEEIREKAENACHRAMKNLEVEVEI